MCAPSSWVKSNGLRVEWTYFTSCPRDNCACFGKKISPSIRARHNRIRFQLEQLCFVFTRADRFVMIESRENCAIAEKLEEKKKVAAKNLRCPFADWRRWSRSRRNIDTTVSHSEMSRLPVLLRSFYCTNLSSISDYDSPSRWVKAKRKEKAIELKTHHLSTHASALHSMPRRDLHQQIVTQRPN